MEERGKQKQKQKQHVQHVPCTYGPKQHTMREELGGRPSSTPKCHL